MLRHAHRPDGAGALVSDERAPRIVGVLDPDGMGGDIGAVAARAAELVAAGADLVDVDTVAGVPRPLDVRWIGRLVRRLVTEGVPVGVTTTSADVVVGVVDAGAEVVADPSGGTLDRFMPAILGAAGVPVVVGQSVAADRAARATTPAAFRIGAARRVEALGEWGVAPDRIVLESGIGQFSRDDSGWAILDHLQSLAGLGHPVLVDATWRALFGADGRTFDEPEPSDEDDAAAIGVGVVAAGAHAWGIRVSNVARAAAVLGGHSSRTRHRAGMSSR